MCRLIVSVVLLVTATLIAEHVPDPTHPPSLRNDSPELRRTSPTNPADQTYPTNQTYLPGPLSFHHLHLNGAGLAEFYGRLFDPSNTYATTFAGQEALRSGPMLMVFGRAGSGIERPTAIWHFGWGAVSSGETYLAHATREVEWEPPLPAGRLHLHVLSASPAQAAAWYRDMLGATIALVSGAEQPVKPRAPLRPEHRVAQGVISIGQFALVLYHADVPLAPTRGQRVDHVALSGRDLDGTLARLRARGVTILEEAAPLGDARAAMIEGPDRIAIELIEQ